MTQFPLDDSFESIPYQKNPGSHWTSKFEGNSLVQELDVASYTRDMAEQMIEIEESVLRKVAAGELRRRGWTVISPEESTGLVELDGVTIIPVHVTRYRLANPQGGYVHRVFDDIEEAARVGREMLGLPPFADQHEVDRQAEKQDYPYSDAWRYFERLGYDMSRVDGQYDR